MSVHQTGFQDRIARINAGAGFTKATVYIGQDIAFTYVPRNKRRAGVSATLGNAGYALSFPFCILVGLLCHVLERYAVYMLVGFPEPDASIDLDMVRTAVAGFALTVVATHLLGLRDKGLMLPKLLGVAGGMLFFHNAVHAWPQVFEQIFSPMWVARIMTETEAHSIFWRGISFPF